MAHSGSHDVTQLLNELRGGRREAFDKLFPQVYDELRRTAQYLLLKERDGHTLNTTALIHEVYLKLANYQKMEWHNRAHFYAVAAQAMRHVLISYARQRNAEKRGGGAISVVFEEDKYSERLLEEVIVLDEALSNLEKINERHVRIIECRFFGGMTIEETAESLGISAITVTRDWRMARAWLKDALNN